MSVFLLSAVLALTVTSATTATMIALVRRPRPGTAQALIVERLTQIALIGAGALAAMLTAGQQ